MRQYERNGVTVDQCYDSDEYPVYGGPHDPHGHHGKRKRRGFLEDLFD
jgi:hypothetical protein